MTKVCFATTCRGRAEHIKKTLPINLENNKKGTFVLLDYGSPDDLIEYISSNHVKDLESGRLVLYSLEAERFRMSHAKNVAHRCAILEGADVLVNLDADNFTGKDFDIYIEELFEKAKCDHKKIFLWARMIQGQMKRGISGRIA